MLKYLLLFSILSNLVLASLSPPEDPYTGDPKQNYLYEQACFYYAFEQSTTRYESPIVRSKMFDSFYLECLTVIWPGCQVLGTSKSVVRETPYYTFEANDIITTTEDFKPIMRAHTPGFAAERLLELDSCWFIFWNPSKPKTDAEKFKKIKFASLKTLYNIHLKNLTGSIRKFQNAGIEESPEKIYVIKKLPNGEHRRFMDFNEFKGAVENSLMWVEVKGLCADLAKGDTYDLRQFLGTYLPMGSISATVFSSRQSEIRIHLLYPMHMLIKSGFPIAMHYSTSKMEPVFCSHSIGLLAFIAALFDENGNRVRNPKEGFTSYLVMTFYSIKL